RVKAEEAAQAKLAEEARIVAAAAEEARNEELARVKAEEAAQAKLSLSEDNKLKAEKELTVSEIVLDDVLISFKKSTNASNNAQKLLFKKLNEKVVSKQQDLDDLKEENDLSEKGIVSAPKAFKSVSAENAEIESLKLEIDNSIKFGDAKIAEIEKLYKERLKKNKNDSLNKEYAKTIELLKSEQLQAKNINQNLITSLNDIKIATVFERNRRIKRAAYDNEDDRYNKDRAALERIKKFTEPSAIPFTKDDFDYGEPLSNIQIVKDVNNTEEGYYLVLAVHSDVSKRDEFLKKVVAAGQKDINFFFDVNTSKYYIYYEKFDNIGQAKNVLDTNKGNKPFNSKMSMVKIVN
ncbi:sprD domain protein, partial [uncultured Algibacter sp.]|uniref:sprD domain protein n=1 Tax=uncultured Algibacter sp. TaxID=298659 RepID=UPI00262D1D0F